MNPTSIALEFYGSTDSRLRENSLTALAAVGSVEAIERLIEAALTDGDGSVRQRGRTEILGLEGAAAEQAVRVLEAKAAGGDHGKEAIALLGMLRQRGRGISRRRLGVREHLRLRLGLASRAGSALLRLPPRRRILFHGALTTAISSLALVLLYNVAIDLPFDLAEGLTAVIVPSLFLGPWLALGASWLSLPKSFHSLVRGGVAMELVLVMLSTLLLAVVLLICLLTVASGEDGPLLAAFVLVVVPLAAAGSRAGTLLAPSRAAMRGQLLQAATGSIFGLAVLSLGLLAVCQWPLTDLLRSIMGALWTLLLPGLIATATVFARLEAAYPPASPQSRSWEPALAGTVVALAAVVTGLLVVDTATSEAEERSHSLAFKHAGQRSITISKTPLEFTLDLASPNTVKARVQNEGRADYYLVLSPATAIPIRRDDPPEVEADLPPGRHKLVVDQYSAGPSQGDPTIENVPYHLAEHLAQHLALQGDDGRGQEDQGNLPELVVVVDVSANQQRLAKDLEGKSSQALLLRFLEAPNEIGEQELADLTRGGFVDCRRGLTCAPSADAWAVAALLQKPADSDGSDRTALARDAQQRGADYPLGLFLQTVEERDPFQIDALSSLEAFREDVQWLILQKLVDCPVSDDYTTCRATAAGRMVYRELQTISAESVAS